MSWNHTTNEDYKGKAVFIYLLNEDSQLDIHILIPPTQS